MRTRMTMAAATVLAMASIAATPAAGQVNWTGGEVIDLLINDVNPDPNSGHIRGLFASADTLATVAQNEGPQYVDPVTGEVSFRSRFGVVRGPLNANHPPNYDTVLQFTLPQNQEYPWEFRTNPEPQTSTPGEYIAFALIYIFDRNQGALVFADGNSDTIELEEEEEDYEACN